MPNISQIVWVFLAYYGVTCFSNIYFLFGPLYESFGASPRAVGLFLSMFYMAMIVCRPVGSFVMERVGIRRTLIWDSFLLAFSAVGITLSTSSPMTLLFFRALSGVSASVFVVATIAYQSMLLDAKTRGRGFALFATGSMIPMATIVPLSEWLLRMGYTHLYLWLPFAVAIICLGISLMIKDNSAVAKRGKAWGSYAEMFRTKGVKVLYVTGFLMSLADGGTLCVASLAADKGVAASWFMLSSASAAIIVRTLGFKIIDMAPRTLLSAPSAALMGLSLLGMSFTSSVLPFVVFGAAFGLGIGTGFPTDLSLVGDLLPLEFHPKATGGLLLAIDGGWVITPLIFGLLSPRLGSSGAFRLIGAFVLISAVAVHCLYWMPIWRERSSSSKI